MPGIAETPPETPENPPAPPAGPSALGKILKLLPTIGIFTGLAVGAFVLVLFVLRPMLPPPAAGNATPAAPPQKFGRVVALDAVVVNVAQTEGRRYLKTTIQMEVADEEKTVKEVEARKAQLLDLLIATLAKKSLVELTTPDALDRLRTELYERVAQELGHEKVRRVFITEFVVQ